MTLIPRWSRATLVLIAGCNIYDIGISTDPNDTSPDAPQRHDASSVPDTYGPPDAYVPPAVCGDGVRAMHEICATPVQLTPPDGQAPSSARLVDANHDGKLDLVYLSPSHIEIALGDGSGNFAVPVDGPAVTSYELAYGDVNDDGAEDLVTVQAPGSGPGLIVWRNDGQGAFARAAYYTGTSTILDVSLANIDRVPGDEIMPNFSAADFGGYRILKYVEGSDVLDSLDISNGDIANNSAIATGDVNGDGYVDIIALDSPDIFVNHSAAYGTSDYGFPPGLDQQSTYYSITTGDVDGDGIADIVASLYAPGGVYELEAFGQTAVLAETPVPTSFSLATGDLDGDGLAEILAGSGNTSSETFNLAVYADVGSFAEVASFDLSAMCGGTVYTTYVDGDANGDGIPDPILTCATSIVILMSTPP